MERIVALYFFMCCIMINAFTQNLSDKDMEKEIKLSGKYYYGESVSINDSISKQDAVEELIAYIARDYKLFKEGDIIADSVKYLSFPRGNKIRSIAYILMANVSNNFKKKEDLKINEIKYSTNNTSTKDTIIQSKNKSNLETIKNVNSEGNINTNLNEKYMVSLLNLSNLDELLKTLDEQKYKGKLIYGKEAAFTSNKESCYIIILNSELKIVTILGMGASKRFDFKINKDVINYKKEFINTNEIWVFFIN